ncbi:MAG: 4Fe-4S dicluster domain-containing protein [Anaerolineae bacterium]|nr:4Fe-4S dicluster domain-containing protein [Anaerolineae bacterium]NIN99351.1 4Fe-4S dicluster domain-containing protein [Anaerolineae bacterium]NIQ82216.1 4Fe-4S dicluster domain-containing protein [Anaerolineae bacterium]
MDVSTARARSRSYASLAQGLAGPEEGLEAEYTRLFVGPGRPVAHPCESVYREGQVMGECTLAVRERYAEEGLGPEDQLLPDHVAVELEFMSYLARKEAEAWEENDVDRAEAYLRQEESFLREHLGRWLPSFCKRLLAGEAHPFYAGLAQRAWEQVAEDMAELRSWLRASAPSSIGDSDGWTVALGPECTLCGLCARVCLPGALRLTRDRGEMQLVFRVEVCDGCAACQQWCPEQAVIVERSARFEGGRVVLVNSPLVICPRCGEPTVSAVLVDKLQERMAAVNEGVRQRLGLCPTCKALFGGNSLAEED